VFSSQSPDVVGGVARTCSERRRRLRTFPSALIDEQPGHSSRPAGRPAANIFIAV